MYDDTLARDHTAMAGPGSPLAYDEWREKIIVLRHLANQMSAIFNETARAMSEKAGLDPGLLGIHPHNALCSYHSGHPWDNVDYNRVLAVQDLLDHQFDAHKMVSAFDEAVRINPHQRWLEAHND